jgi:outer membrane receptor protein involved in Fe transport
MLFGSGTIETIRRGRSASASLRSMRALLAGAASLSAITAALQPACAQSASPAASQTAQAPVEEIVVTGTRVVRDGYEAPTPLTVVGIEQIQQQAPPNIADYVNTLPVFSASTTPATGTQSASSGQAGINALNLRNLGTTRTLILVDGQRSVGATTTGLVDINTVPQQLITRVDVVTGGASAAYGSDAVAGVVNFILDKKFVGVKAELSGGLTTYGDNRNYKMAATAGTGFADDRGHFIISGEANYTDGILQPMRSWNETGAGIMNNPAYAATNGQPQRIVVSQMAVATATRGGLITAGPLKGIAFGPGGTPYQFNYGSLVSGANMSGGEWQANEFNTTSQSLEPQEARQGVFARASYDVTPDLEVYEQFSWNYDHSFSYCCYNEYYGNLTVKADNAFIPSTVAAQIAANKLTAITMGSLLADVGVVATDNKRMIVRNVVGASGNVDAFGSRWGWDAYYQYGVSMNSESLDTVINNGAFASAADAARNPATGAIVCRSTLSAAGNGCVPYDLFGIGVNSQAAKNYVLGTPHTNVDFTEKVVAASAHGEPFDDWAGPVSLATGIEHRVESATGTADPLSLVNGWGFGNFHPTIGEYNVTEGFVETVVPVARDVAWAKSLDVNAAARFTGYSTAGYVTTWKVGATYALIDDIRFRATRSRDIRAPNLSELFNAGSANSNFVINDSNQVSTAYLGLRVGNPLLVPEVADTTGVGVVLQPGFAPGLSASVDYWNIDLGNAITSLSAQQIVDLCFQGGQAYCQAINGGSPLTAGPSNVIRIQPFNIAQQVVRGIDFEGSYRTPLSAIDDSWNGNLVARILATHYMKNYTNTTVTPPTDTAGATPRSWRGTATLSYDNDILSMSVGARFLSAGVRNTSFVECVSGCPASTTTNPTINNNHLPGATYFDVSLSYNVAAGADTGAKIQVFLNVRNLLNKDPAIVATGPSGTPQDVYTTDPGLYDADGRTFRAGIRFRM